MKKVNIEILKKIRAEAEESVASIPDMHYIKKESCENEFIIN
jgi:hypothetical protein